MATAKSRRIMGRDKFDKYLKEVFSDHMVSMDTDDIWVEIEKTLPPAKTISKTSLWIIGLFAVSAISFWLLSTPVDSRTYEAGTHSTELATKLSSTSGSAELAIASGELEHNDQSMIGQRGDLKAQFGVTQALEQNTDNAKVPLSIADLNASTPTSNLQLEDLQSETSVKSVESSANSSSTQLSIAKDNTLTSEQNQNIITPASFAKEDRNSSLLQEGDQDVVVTTTIEAEQGTPSLKEDVSASAMTVRHMDLTVLSPLPTGLRESSGLFASEDATLSLPSLNNCYDFKGRSWAMGLDIYSGLSWADKKLEFKTSEAGNPEYINTRNDTESKLEAFDAGLGISFFHRKGFLISTGINYSQINEKFHHISTQTIPRFDSIVVRINIDSFGMADSIREWRQITVQTTREVVTYNSYRMIDIPLALGYQLHRDKWTFEASGGVLFNVLYKKKGEILDQSRNVVEITDNNEVFKDQVGMSVFGGIKAIYPLTDRIGLYAEPYGRFNLKSITSDAYVLNQRYNNFGLRLGARITL